MKKLTKEEFQGILNSAEEYVPKDLTDYIIIIQSYDTTEYLEMNRKAYLLSFSERGIDTTNFKEDVFQSNRSYWEKYVSGLVETNSQMTKSFSKILKKNSYRYMVADKSDLERLPAEEYRYVIKIKVISIKANPENAGYVTWFNGYFYDRLLKNSYKLFASRNYRLHDIIKYTSKNR